MTITILLKTYNGATTIDASDGCFRGLLDQLFSTVIALRRHDCNAGSYLLNASGKPQVVSNKTFASWR